jgi:hypothetical protein
MLLKKTTLSKRGEAYAEAGELLEKYIQVRNNPWSPSNPEGLLSLLPSENVGKKSSSHSLSMKVNQLQC